jgi:serine/threonine protein kinase
VASRGPNYLSENFVQDPNRLGTDGYRAPELINYSRFNEKVDVWALGCILYELIVSKPLFINDSAVVQYAEEAIQATETPMVIQPVSSQLKISLEKFGWKPKIEIKGAVIQMFAVDPDERPAAGDLVNDAFKRLIDSRAPGLERRQTGPI